MPFLPARLSRRPVVSVIRLDGVIGAGARFGGQTLSDAALAPMIERAFSRGVRAVALAVNSPGGSPAQSSLIAARIRRLAEERGIRVFAFAEDVAASGGYWLACAADEIYADASSILGSIGVISAGFGLNELIGRHGVERRLYTAGTRKALLDPFSPEKPEDVARLDALLKQLHGTFIAHVKARRGERLKGEDLFNGDVFVGQEAVDAGLADGLAHLVPRMKAEFGDKTRFNVIRQRRGMLRRLGGQVLADALGQAEDRLARAQYGL